MTASRARPAGAPLLGLGVAVAAVSTSAILVRWSDAPSLVAAFYRVLFTVGLLAPVAVVRHGERFRSLRRRDWVVATAAGLALAVHFAAWFESLSWTSVAASVTLVQVQPVVVAVGAFLLLDERVTRRMGLGIALALAGAVVLSAGDLLAGAATVGAWPALGNALALVGALTGAGYVLAGRSLRQRLPLLPYVTIVYATCALALGAMVAGAGHQVTGYAGREWVLFLAMAVGPGLLGHTLVNWVLAHLESSVVSVALVGEPVGSTLLAALLLAEVPGVPTLVGGVVVLAGILLTVRGRPAAG